MSGGGASPSERRVSFVPLPCAVIDEILPTLKDTELRVLLVVLRQTWGWRDENGKTKQRDWLSHQQLKQRTGRASEAVSAAIDTLVGRGLIGIRDDRGSLLAEAWERRRVNGRMYFELGPVLGLVSARALKTEIAKSKTTTPDVGSISCRFRNSEQPEISNQSPTPPLPAEKKARIEAAKKAIRERLGRQN